MRDTRPLLLETDFPPIFRAKLDTLQMNLGYLCNLSCTHCHVNAGPTRTELMDADTVNLALEVIKQQSITTIDLTGGSPEMNPEFCRLVLEAKKLGVVVINRCNPTILVEPGYEHLPEFFAEQSMVIVASLPCYTEQNVDAQRGQGVFQDSIAGLLALNAVGYGVEGSGLTLNLVYNPDDPILPPDQTLLKADYKEALSRDHGVIFNDLFALANMPISRYGARLLAKNQYTDYMQLLRNAFSEPNLETVMCRNLLSVDYQGFVYDCDFNQMLALPTLATDKVKPHLSDFLNIDVEGRPITIGEHCYACTAGQGSSCGGALN
ncbi:MAG: radical SAM/Cys-rich protein [Flavobacterium sp.]|jgi:radical SAM/Cys-rich protein